MSIEANLREIKAQIPENINLVAVSKFHPESAILEAYATGHRIFGESRMQELVPKCEVLPKDIEWHFIGHLQTNKVKNIVPYVHTIHSVDSLKLLLEIEKYAKAIERPINCLIEVHIAQEESKYGFSYENCRQFFMDNDWKKCIFANIVGLMGIATDTDDEKQIAEEFRKLQNFYKEIKQTFFKENPNFNQLSMGMSHDYKIAIEEGSTMIRIGTSIFGERDYNK